MSPIQGHWKSLTAQAELLNCCSQISIPALYFYNLSQRDCITNAQKKYRRNKKNKKTGLALYWDNNPTQCHGYNCLVVMKWDLFAHAHRHKLSSFVTGSMSKRVIQTIFETHLAGPRQKIKLWKLWLKFNLNPIHDLFLNLTKFISCLNLTKERGKIKVKSHRRVKIKV